mmetsp:Transcript_109819/g.276243  ORF Transcript_109819/g.276243 Transcript_109819/m.276243 type:complete len:236 (+) Transcript_109819:15-722(+)
MFAAPSAMQRLVQNRQICRCICLFAICLVLRSDFEWHAASSIRAVTFSCPRLLGADKGDPTIRRRFVYVQQVADVPVGREQGRRSAAIATVLGMGLVEFPDFAWAGGIDAARDKLLASVTVLDDLLANYDAVVKAGKGDGVRQKLMLLSDIQKTCLELAPVAEDPDQFLAALEEFVLAASRADGNAYSSVFAGGSGDPKKNNPTVFLNRAKDDIGAMRAEAGKMVKALGGAVMSS